jgi:hypothetical protein
LSCLGKLFTTILNKRLNAYSDKFLLINESQVGFRQGYSTNDKYIFFVLTYIWYFTWIEYTIKQFNINRYKQMCRWFYIFINYIIIATFLLCFYIFNAYSDKFLLINESQVGFRQGYSTNDKYIFFVLIIWTFNLEKKKMFCAFIDFEKTFEKVSKSFKYKENRKGY